MIVKIFVFSQNAVIFNIFCVSAFFRQTFHTKITQLSNHDKDKN